ncbi:hypothetical protein CYMTET_31008, partial [Cymbomonas tetramitiformis]
AIFKGEVLQAPGTTEYAEDYCEVLLFSNDEPLLEKIDYYFMAQDARDKEVEEEMQANQMRMSMIMDRPGTSDGCKAAVPRGDRATPMMPSGGMLPTQSVMFASGALAGTFPAGAQPFQSIASAAGSKRPPRAPTKPSNGGTVVLEALSCWDGSAAQAGLTGLEIYDVEGQVLDPGTDFTIALEQSVAPEVDLRASITGGGQYEQLMTILVDPCNMTVDPNHMVLIPRDGDSGRWARIVVKMTPGVNIGHLRVWNYNDGVDGSFSGIKRLKVSLHGQVVHSGFLLRKAPGTMCFDFGQEVELVSQEEGASPKGPEGVVSRGRNISTPNPYGAAAALGRSGSSGAPREALSPLTPNLPSGFIFKLVMHATLGCPHYIGLNGLELYDENGCVIEFDASNVAAEPVASINDMPDVAARGGDVRTLDKLYDALNDTFDDNHMWLTPFDPDTPTTLYIHFREPITISMLKVWNYAKTPNRGCAACSVYMDDALLFEGDLRQSPSRTDSAATLLDMCQSILFSQDADLLAREANHIFQPGDVKLQLFNDNVPVSCPKTPTNRPGTSVVGQ